MLFCRRCGQSKYINNDLFVEYVSISGTETRYIDSEIGETLDYGDTNTDDTGESEYECPCCGTNSIDFEWGSGDEVEDEKEAKGLRETYDLIHTQEIKERQLELDKMDMAEKMKNSDWDLDAN